jgi:hypothetical protein
MEVHIIRLAVALERTKELPVPRLAELLLRPEWGPFPA